MFSLLKYKADPSSHLMMVVACGCVVAIVITWMAGGEGDGKNEPNFTTQRNTLSFNFILS